MLTEFLIENTKADFLKRLVDNDFRKKVLIELAKEPILILLVKFSK